MRIDLPLRASFAALVLGLTLAVAASGAERGPNVLFIALDDLNDWIGCLGGHPQTITPNLDRFTQEGVTFTNTFCPSPHCCPSRASFHTGLYPSRHGVWNNVNVSNALSRGLFDGVRCWSEEFDPNEYRMRFHGKWHVSDYEDMDERNSILCARIP